MIPEVVAHRGESCDAPENTLAAFRLAWARKVPAIELDVQFSRDGRLVVIHDERTGRVSAVDRVIRETDWAELQEIEVGGWKAPQYAGEKLCLLEDALRTIPETGRCFVEMKVGPEGVPALVRAVQAAGVTPSQIAVISFDAGTCEETKRALPQVPVYFLSSFRRDPETGEWSPPIEEIIATAQRIGADGVDLDQRGPIDAELVRKVREAGLGLYFWTVNDDQRALKLAALGVDGFASDKGAWMVRLLKDREAGSSCN